MRFFRTLLILFHRYLGIVLCLVFVVWFLSGIAMIYARVMPELTPTSRLQHLSPLDFEKVLLSPSEAAERAAMTPSISKVLLLTIMGRPAYQFSTPEITIVFADNGEVMLPPDHNQSLAVAADFMRLPQSSLHHVRAIERPDQWTLLNYRQMPMHKIAAADAAHTELYVSEVSGEVAVVTTRGSRMLAWISAIPHWLYFEGLRRNGLLWTRTVLWVSGIATVATLLGLVLAVIQYSRRPPHIPYAGWMRWHYITGALFGVFTLTWVFSGFLSMEPWDWASEGGLGKGMQTAFSGGALDLTQFPKMDGDRWKALQGEIPSADIKEVEFLRIQGNPYYVVRGPGFVPVLASADPVIIRHEAFSTESLVGRAKEANPDVAIAEVRELTSYDAYYYSRDGAAPLPVLRLKFTDPDKTWFYVDPKFGRILARYQRKERLQRWIHHGLHSLDFSFWYYNRPLWDIGVIVLCAGGALLSGIGVLIAVRRARRDVRRIVPRQTRNSRA